MKLKSAETIENALQNKNHRYPDRNDSRFNKGLLLPSLSPRFKFSEPCCAFTIGSCFARNIEEALLHYDIEMPTRNFTVPLVESIGRSNGLLNEYNPGTISQRILFALECRRLPDALIVPDRDGFLDLALPSNFPVSYERALARRQEIDAVYSRLATSDILIITLGLIESWFDKETNLYLNRMPPLPFMKKHENRFEFHRLDISDTCELLEPALHAAVDVGIKKILLTVSPVPLRLTFTADDAVVANSYSKAVLRVCAEKMINIFKEVDYLPSFEVVNSAGLPAFNDDNIHVINEVVELIVKSMTDAYFNTSK